jgi:hypothetical protein
VCLRRKERERGSKEGGESERARLKKEKKKRD